MCKWGTTTLVNVLIQADLSCTGTQHWKKMQIDSCIAPIVGALQKGGIDMRGSCCGHGKPLEGNIHLQDGRILVITDERYWQHWRWAILALRRAARLTLVGMRNQLDPWLNWLALWRRSVWKSERRRIITLDESHDVMKIKRDPPDPAESGGRFLSFLGGGGGPELQHGLAGPPPKDSRG